MIRYFTKKLIKLILFLFILSYICSGHSAHATECSLTPALQPVTKTLQIVKI